MTGYKFLALGAVAPFSKTAWPKPAAGNPGAWISAPAPLDVRRTGVHVCRVPDLAYWMNEELWEVEVDGERFPGVNALVVERARLVRSVDGWTDAIREELRRVSVAHAENAAAPAPPEKRDAALELVGHARPAECPPIVAAYVTAVAVSKLARDEAGAVAAFAAEREWQSRWLADALALEA